ncbi:class F sortase [Planctomonas psychrotolerans]|uniref:class F sortase n=1 Tax=Planctomonas psychrotolerans TaxID=2528712 RepID=UPI00123C4900|nr:class F sortase [Planctomonas psychrotolerans]
MMKNNRRGSLLAAAAAVLLAAGGTAIVLGAAGTDGPPAIPTSSPTVAAEAPTPAETPENPAPVAEAETPEPVIPAPTTTPAAPEQPADTVLAPATPLRLSVPAIGVDSELMHLGKNADGTVEVPPLGEYSPAGWYRGSPTPGEVGPSVMLGHVDSAAGPSVFYRLGDLRPGDEVSVTREDGTIAVFTVDRLEQYAKDEFPTVAVYGNTDDAQLRLITCGGDFDRSIGHYVDNIVVFASLTSTTSA